MFGGIGAGFLCHIHCLEVVQAAGFIGAVAHRSGAAPVAAGLGIAQVQALVLGEVWVGKHIEQPALAGGNDVRYAIHNPSQGAAPLRNQPFVV